MERAWELRGLCWRMPLGFVIPSRMYSFPNEWERRLRAHFLTNSKLNVVVVVVTIVGVFYHKTAPALRYHYVNFVPICFPPAPFTQNLGNSLTPPTKPGAARWLVSTLLAGSIRPASASEAVCSRGAPRQSR